MSEVAKGKAFKYWDHVLKKKKWKIHSTSTYSKAKYDKLHAK